MTDFPKVFLRKLLALWQISQRLRNRGASSELLYVYSLEPRPRTQVGPDIWLPEVISSLKWDRSSTHQHWERSCRSHPSNKGVGNRVKVQSAPEGCALTRNSSQLCIGDGGWKSVRRAADSGSHGRDKAIDSTVGSTFFSQKGTIRWRSNTSFKQFQ